MLDTVRFSGHFYLHDPSRASKEKKDPEEASTLTHKPSPPASSLGHYTTPLQKLSFSQLVNGESVLLGGYSILLFKIPNKIFLHGGLVFLEIDWVDALFCALAFLY